MASLSLSLSRTFDECVGTHIFLSLSLSRVSFFLHTYVRICIIGKHTLVISDTYAYLSTLYSAVHLPCIIQTPFFPRSRSLSLFLSRALSRVFPNNRKITFQTNIRKDTSSYVSLIFPGEEKKKKKKKVREKELQDSIAQAKKKPTHDPPCKFEISSRDRRA